MIVESKVTNFYFLPNMYENVFVQPMLNLTHPNNFFFCRISKTTLAIKQKK